MNNLEPIEVLRGHLVEIHRALDAAYGFQTAHDLTKVFEAMGATPRPSNLSKALEKARDRVAYYIQDEDELPE